MTKRGRGGRVACARERRDDPLTRAIQEVRRKEMAREWRRAGRPVCSVYATCPCCGQQVRTSRGMRDVATGQYCAACGARLTHVRPLPLVRCPACGHTARWMQHCPHCGRTMPPAPRVGLRRLTAPETAYATKARRKRK